MDQWYDRSKPVLHKRKAIELRELLCNKALGDQVCPESHGVPFHVSPKP